MKRFASHKPFVGQSVFAFIGVDAAAGVATDAAVRSVGR